MGYRDLRELIERLAATGNLRRITTRVDWKYELSAIAKRALDRKCPALLFENIKDYTTPVLVNTFGTVPRMAMALGLEHGAHISEVVRQFKDKIGSALKPRLVARGPCKENIQMGDDVDVLKFPTPLWHELDGGRYIGTLASVLTRDPDTGWQNAGTYRVMIHNKNTVGVLIARMQHIGLIYEKYEAMNKPMPTAIAIGMDPACVIASSSQLPGGVDEWDMAGALKGEPLEVVKCQTVDLEVPATAEIVLEGEIPAFERMNEGPYGEHTGYYGGGITPRPFMNVRCITHRNNPILQGLYEGKPIAEEHQLSTVIRDAMVLRVLEDVGFPGIRGVHHPTGGNPAFSAVISMKKSYEGQPLDAARILLGAKEGATVKTVIIVDDDIDIYNLEDVWFAVNARVQASRGISITRGNRGSFLDPSVPPEWHGISDKMVIDATWPMTPDFPARAEWNGLRHPPEALPPQEVMKLVEKRWVEYGID